MNETPLLHITEASSGRAKTTSGVVTLTGVICCDTDVAKEWNPCDAQIRPGAICPISDDSYELPFLNMFTYGIGMRVVSWDFHAISYFSIFMDLLVLLFWYSLGRYW